MKKILFLSFFFFLICNIALAGSDENTLERPRYKIEVDSQVIKATPYEITFENGKEIHHDENVEWYTDMTVYKFISKDLDENGKVLAMPTKKPTIFLLSGGAFVNLHNQDELNPDYSSLHSSLKLATKLTHGGDYNVIWIRYDTATGADATMINKLFQTLQIFHPNNSSYTNGTESKVKLEYASLAAFRDFRVKFQTEVNTNASIGKNNVFVAGLSAGAVLTLYSVFLDQDHNDEKLIHQKYVLEIVDVTGNVVSRSYIENGKQQIATNNLRPGNYKIIIHANDEIITGSFIINR